MGMIERENRILDKLRLYNQFGSKVEEYLIYRAKPYQLRQHPAFQEYLNDRMSVPSKLRRLFDLVATRPKSKDDEGFRFFRDSDVDS